MSHVLYYIPQGQLCQNNHFDFLVNVLDNSPQGNTLYDNMLVWASRSEMSQMRLAPFASCYTVPFAHVKCAQTKWVFGIWHGRVKKHNQIWKYIQKLWILMPRYSFEHFLNDRQGNHSGRTEDAVFPLWSPSLPALFTLLPTSYIKGLSTEKHSVGKMPCLRVCVCCICLPLLGSPTQTNHCFTIILHVLTRVWVCVCACVN